MMIIVQDSKGNTLNLSNARTITKYQLDNVLATYENGDQYLIYECDLGLFSLTYVVKPILSFQFEWKKLETDY